MIKASMTVGALLLLGLVSYVVQRWGCPWASSPDGATLALEPDMSAAGTLAVATLPMLALVGSVLVTRSNRHRE